MAPSKRDTFVRHLDPLKLMWEDADGNPHFSIEDALRVFEFPDTPANREAVDRILTNLIHMANPDATIIKRDEPDNPEFFEQ